MNDLTTREPANDPQDLERLLVARENAGDVTGMTALFEPDAVVDIGGGTFLRGKEAIHEFFTKLQVTGFGPEKRKFEFGEQRPALIYWQVYRHLSALLRGRLRRRLNQALNDNLRGLAFHCRTIIPECRSASPSPHR